ncbi:MAG: bifunctional metallophosphatase/5'-nucleotidase [Gemmatimonadaceae bacterium]
MRFSSLLLLGLAPVVSACTPRRVATTASSQSTNAGETVVTILHFNDVYEITPVEGGHAGGLARVATLRRQLAAVHPSILTTLGGDFISPSALGTARVDGERLAGRQMVAVLNAVGLDWTTLGNHEFDVSEAAFRARVAESRFHYVIANVTDTTGRPFPGTVPHAIVLLKVGARTVRVGLVGAVLNSNRVAWVQYSDPIATIKAHVAMIRDSVDIVVALTHLAIADDQRLVESVPGIDLVLGGHEHENYQLRRGENFTPIIKGDANVRTVAVVSIRLGRPGSRAVVESQLVPINESIAADASVAAEVRHWLDLGFAGYRELGFEPDAVVATLTSPLDGREATVRTRAGSLSDAILAGMRREAPDAEIAIFNGGSIRVDDVIPPGPITQYDIIRILPFGGKLVRADVEGALLQRVLEQGRANSGSGGYLQVLGATLNGGQLLVGGAPVDASRRYRVVTNDFLLTGAESGLSFFSRAAPGVSVVRELRDVRLSLIDELRATPR